MWTWLLIQLSTDAAAADVQPPDVVIQVREDVSVIAVREDVSVIAV